MSTNKQALKPGTYAILFRDNWDGERDVYETLATLGDDLIWYHHENGKALIECEGDEVLKAWPLDDGGNVLALLDELEAAENLAKQQGNIAVALLDEVTTLRRNADDKAPELRSQLEEAEKRIAELNEFVQHVKKCLVKNDEYAPLSHEVIDTILGINAAGITVKGE